MKSKIYDCFIFNDELDLLELRLRFLYDSVDYFVICEAPRTLSGNEKKLNYSENKVRYAKYEAKIIHLIAPQNLNLKLWEYEYFQRNYLMEGLTSCNDDDIILISDVDEIVNLKTVLQVWDQRVPALIELPLYYYFLNLKSKITYRVNLITPYSFIKGKNIGERNATYPTWTQNIIKSKKINTGWHYSYLFGFEIGKYHSKLKSFSHQEYDTPFYLNEERIKKCIKWGIDLFGRKDFLYKVTNIKNNELYEMAKQMGLDDKIISPLSYHYFTKEGLHILINWEIKPRFDRLVYLAKYYAKRIPQKLFEK
jgi:beta-1,4-mannosyl-glycoprotein beta-1,4-N-acetylglucosaminyltransferase